MTNMVPPERSATACDAYGFGIEAGEEQELYDASLAALAKQVALLPG